MQNAGSDFRMTLQITPIGVRHRIQHDASNVGMAAHGIHFIMVKFTRLQQDRIRDTNLSYIVKLCRHFDHFGK